MHGWVLPIDRYAFAGARDLHEISSSDRFWHSWFWLQIQGLGHESVYKIMFSIYMLDNFVSTIDHRRNGVQLSECDVDVPFTWKTNKMEHSGELNNNNKNLNHNIILYSGLFWVGEEGRCKSSHKYCVYNRCFTRFPLAACSGYINGRMIMSPFENWCLWFTVGSLFRVYDETFSSWKHKQTEKADVAR